MLWADMMPLLCSQLLWCYCHTLNSSDVTAILIFIKLLKSQFQKVWHHCDIMPFYNLWHHCHDSRLMWCHCYFCFYLALMISKGVTSLWFFIFLKHFSDAVSWLCSQLLWCPCDALNCNDVTAIITFIQLLKWCSLNVWCHSDFVFFRVF